MKTLVSKIHKLRDQYQSMVQSNRSFSLDGWARTHCTYHSNAIEGNTLTEIQTSLIINDGISISGKRIIEIQEAKNHARAIDVITTWVGFKFITNLGIQELLEIHAIILSDIHESYAGRRRDVPVRIQGSSTILPNYAKVPLLMQQREEEFQVNAKDPLLLAIQAHYDIVTIHPFIDGNGRTARLFMNAVLLLAGFPLVTVIVEKREQYLSSLEQAQTKGNYKAYQQFMLEIIYDEMQVMMESS